MIIVFDLDDTIYRERDFFLNGVLCVSKYLIENYNFERNISNKIVHREKVFGRAKLLGCISKKALTACIRGKQNSKVHTSKPKENNGCKKARRNRY